jgi:glutamine amidotransferase
MIGILNYGMGNLQSVRNALDRLAVPCRVIAEAAAIRECQQLILPGVGAFGQAMERINGLGFAEALREFAMIERKPLLGICLGMQLLMESSTENGLQAGLGLIGGTVESLSEEVAALPLPHMGWNDVTPAPGSRLLQNIDGGDRNFYFVHNYHCVARQRTSVAGTTVYGIILDAVIEQGNIFGCQFHPEKSQGNGLAVLKNFAGLPC